MALPSSGEISIGDIKTEFSGSVGSLTAYSIAAGKTAPHAISEFYSYSFTRTNTYYYTNDGVNDYIKGTWSGQTSLHNNDWSISFWVRQNQSSKSSQQLWDFNANSTLNSGSTTDRVFLQYNGSSNRFIARIRTSGVNFDRQWNLHTNSSATGVTSSSIGWTTSQRGYTNIDDFTLLTLTYDSSQSTGSAAFKLYWNDAELTSSVSSASGTRSAATFASLCLCASQHNISGGNANVDIDEWTFYNDVLTSGEVATLYNNGISAAADTLHTDNLSEAVSFGASNTLDLYASNYSGTITGGSTVAY